MILIRNWRLMDAEPFGKLLWFNSGSEESSLRALTGDEQTAYLDRVGSVSALDEDEDSLELKLG